MIKGKECINRYVLQMKRDGINSTYKEEEHMVSLTFSEQVKIILSRRRMTIKELAEIIEEKTGKKMSRQNLTQRLNRDNFQEQDMRMVADILGCSFQLNILDNSMPVQNGTIIPTQEELGKVNKRRNQAMGKKEIGEEELERDITMGELVDMMSVTEAEIERLVEDMPESRELEQEERIVPESVIKTVIKDEADHIQLQAEVQTEESAVETPQMPPQEPQDQEPESAFDNERETKKTLRFAKPNLSVVRPGIHHQTQEEEAPPVMQEVSEEEKLQLGEENPYTGREYESNSVRIHPKRIGYVQVYDRSEHKWTDMTEWAFLGYQERKKALLGDDYEPPIYLD